MTYIVRVVNACTVPLSVIFFLFLLCEGNLIKIDKSKLF